MAMCILQYRDGRTETRSIGSEILGRRLIVPRVVGRPATTADYSVAFAGYDVTSFEDDVFLRVDGNGPNGELLFVQEDA